MSLASPLRGARDAARLLAARWRLSRALPRADGGALRVLRAVQTALHREEAPDERAWMERIEVLRHGLLRSREQLTMVDYGAGAPDLALTPDAMYAGRTVTRTVGEVCGGSKAAFWARVLFHLVRERRPASCVELGTNLGVSAAYQAAALALNGRGHLVTLEGAGPVAALARRNLEGLGLGARAAVVTGRFQDTLAEVLRQAEPVDYAFVDGHHDEHATLRYFDQIHPHLAPGAVLVFDDIAWSPGMRRCWSALQADERVRTSVDLGAMGVCLPGPASAPRQRLRFPLA
jgi:predicted O-methyltransferase YrrM